MMKDSNILDELFRSKLKDFEKTPPPQMWEQIQAGMKSRGRQRIMPIIRMSAAAAAVIIALVVGWWVPRDNRHDSGNDLTEGYNIPIPRDKDYETDNQQGNTLIDKLPGDEDPRPSINGKERDIDQKVMPPSANARRQTTLAVLSARPPKKIATQSHMPDLAVRQTSTTSPYSTLTDSELAMVARNSILVDNHSGKQRNKNKWGVEATVAPSYAVYKNSYSDLYASNMAGKGEAGSFKIDGGLALSYRAGTRWSFQTGMYYNQLEQSSNTNDSPQPSNDLMTFSNNKIQFVDGNMHMNAAAGVIEITDINVPVALSMDQASAPYKTTRSATLSLMNDYLLKQQFEYIEIPLNIRYRLIEKAIGLHLMGGLSTNILINNAAYMKDENGETKIGSTKDMNAFNYAAKTGLGIGFDLSPRLQIMVEPQFKYYLNSLNTNSELTFKPYTFGVFTGISYFF